MAAFPSAEAEVLVDRIVPALKVQAVVSELPFVALNMSLPGPVLENVTLAFIDVLKVTFTPVSTFMLLPEPTS